MMKSACEVTFRPLFFVLLYTDFIMNIYIILIKENALYTQVISNIFSLPYIDMCVSACVCVYAQNACFDIPTKDVCIQKFDTLCMQWLYFYSFWEGLFNRLARGCISITAVGWNELGDDLQ